MKDVIVVGGGLGGLIVGAELKRRGKDVLVLEATAEAAGVAASVREDGYILEPGAGSLLWPNDDLGPIFDSAGIEMLPAKAEAKARFVYERGTLYEIPESPTTSRHSTKWTCFSATRRKRSGSTTTTALR